MSRLNCGCTRREMLRSLVGGSMLLPGIVSSILANENPGAEVDPLAPKTPDFPARAKRVIFLYMSGGVSHVDSFDPKPKLFSDHGRKEPLGLLKKPSWNFKAHGKCGTEVSDLLPHMAGCVDDLCVIRSMRADHG